MVSANVLTRPDRPSLRAGATDVGNDDYLEARPRLLGAALRTLGNWTEAEDIVQDAWLRWQGYDRAAVRDARAFLVTTTTRLAINTACSARMRREAAVGDALPEPSDAGTDDPAAGAERRDELELAIELLLERLAPLERAAFVLRQAFDYPYPEIARMLRISEANARQLVSRAGRQLAAERRRPVDHAEKHRLVQAFVAAARRGEVGALEELLVRRAVEPRTTVVPGSVTRERADRS